MGNQADKNNSDNSVDYEGSLSEGGNPAPPGAKTPGQTPSQPPSPFSPTKSSLKYQSDAQVGSYTLTVFQKKLLKQKWDHINKAGPGGIGAIIFSKLLSKKPELREMFQKAEIVDVFSKETGSNVAAHQKLLVELLDDAVNHLDNLDEVGQKCVRYGEAHANLHGRGFEASLWDFFGQVAVQSITSLDVIRRHRELVRAWRILASFLVDKLRQGYESGKS